MRLSGEVGLAHDLVNYMTYTPEHYRLGKIAYDAYIAQSGGVSLISGDKLPEFGLLKQTIQDAWAAAGLAVAAHTEIAVRD